MFVVSCSKDVSKPSVNVGAGKMKAVIGGTTYDLTISKILTKGSGDSLSYLIIGTDSIHTVTIVFKDIPSIEATDYPCGFLSAGKGGYVYAIYEASNNDSSYNCDGIGSSGNIKIVSISSSAMTGSFSLDAMNTEDTTQIMKITGEFNGDVYPVDGIDLPIGIGKMTVEVNGVAFYNSFMTESGVTTLGETTTLNITGTSSDGQSIIFLFDNFLPEIGIEYSTGFQGKSITKKLTARYVKESKFSYVANSSNPEANFGKVKIFKKTGDIMKYGNIQGTFSFVAQSIDDPTLKVTVRNGMFSAKIKDYH